MSTGKLVFLVVVLAAAMPVGALVAWLELRRSPEISDVRAESSSGPPRSAPDGSAATSEERAYLRALAAIDPGLVVNEDRAISRAENTCLDIDSGKTGDVLVNNVIQRLSGGNATIDQRQARDAIELMERWICPGWRTEWASRHPSKAP